MTLNLVDQRSQLYGTSDYQQYIRYLTNGVRYLRKKLNLAKRGGKAETKSNEQIAFMCAERCWATAMSLSASLEQGLQTKSNLKSRMKSKLAKAAKLAQLVEPTNSEFKTLKHLILGDFYFYFKKWELVIKEFGKVHLEMSSNYSENVTSSTLTKKVDPAIRMALKQLNLNSEADIELAAKKYVGGDQEIEEDSCDAVDFRKFKAEVKFSKLGRLLSKTNLGSVEDKIKVWQQCLAEVEELILSINDAGGSTRDRNLDVLNSYIKFELLKMQMVRDMAIASKAKHSLYGVCVQECELMAELPGVYNDDELVTSVLSMKSYFQTKHYLKLQHKAVAGSLDALALARRAFDFDQTVEVDGLPISIEDCTELKNEVKDNLANVYTAFVLRKEVLKRETVLGSKTSDLGIHQVNKRVADIDVAHLEPVMVKPIFFDMAYNQLSLESVEEKKKGGKILGLF